MTLTACTWRCAGGLGESVLARRTRVHISCPEAGGIRSSRAGWLSAIRQRRQRSIWAAVEGVAGDNKRSRRGAQSHSCRRSGGGVRHSRHSSSSSSQVGTTESVVTGGATRQSSRRWSRRPSPGACILPPSPGLLLRDTRVIGRRRMARATDVRRRPFAAVVCAANEEVRDADVVFVTPEEAKLLVNEQAYTVIDVRDNSQFQRSHMHKSVHVPLFVENTDMDPETIVKRQMHTMMTGTLYGTAFTKPNDGFLSTIEARFPKNSKLLLVCQEGLRSARAAEDLVDAGYQQVRCLTSGLQKVKPGMFEKEGERELQDAGKAGIAAIQGQISVVLGTVLITLYLLLKLFPDQAEEIFNRFAP